MAPVTARPKPLIENSALPALAALGAVSALAWIYLASAPGPASAATDMPGMPGMAMGPTTWTPAQAGEVLAMWAAMAVAMMLPAAAPALLKVGAAGARGAGRVLAFAAGYLLLWLLVSVAAAGLQWAGERAGVLSGGGFRDRGLANLAVAAVGLSQLLPTKRACLAGCAARGQAPDGSGGWRAAAAGLRYGLPCLGSSAPLMLLPAATGLMGAPWLAALTLWLVAERAAPRGERLAALGGVALIALAASRLQWVR
jgi:predicted metal-binding membrane protein